MWALDIRKTGKCSGAEVLQKKIKSRIIINLSMFSVKSAGFPENVANQGLKETFIENLNYRVMIFILWNINEASYGRMPSLLFLYNEGECQARSSVNINLKLHLSFPHTKLNMASEEFLFWCFHGVLLSIIVPYWLCHIQLYGREQYARFLKCNLCSTEERTGIKHQREQMIKNFTS